MHSVFATLCIRVVLRMWEVGAKYDGRHSLNQNFYKNFLTNRGGGAKGIKNYSPKKQKKNLSQEQKIFENFYQVTSDGRPGAMTPLAPSLMRVCCIYVLYVYMYMRFRTKRAQKKTQKFSKQF